MRPLLRVAGSVGAVVGVVICLVAGLARLRGGYYLGGYAIMPLFEVGVGVMVASALATLHSREPGS